MSPEELRKELAEGVLRPAYLIVGEEPLLRDDALAAIRREALADGTRDFNLDRLDGPSTSPGALLDSVRTLPVMAPRRVVVLRDPEGGRGSSAPLTEAVAEAVAELGPESGTVLVVVALRVDGRARWARSFGKARVDCDPPRRQRDLVGFARDEAERQGLKLERGAAELLAERVGSQLLMLRQEIAKAGLLAGVSGKVTRDHVSSAVSDVAEEPIWDLTDAIGEGRAADALAVLMKLLGAGAAPPLVLAALANHFRRLLRLRSGGSVAGPPFVRRKLEAQAGRYSEGRLLACLRAIGQTDLALKGEGGLRPQLAMERLVIGLVG